jgi:hypothetical protein
MHLRRQVSKPSAGCNFLTPARPSIINQAAANWVKRVSIAEYNFFPFDRGDIERFQRHIENNAILMKKQLIKKRCLAAASTRLSGIANSLSQLMINLSPPDLLACFLLSFYLDSLSECG